MKELSQLVYSPLMEETKEQVGWDKETIEFALENKKLIEQTIRGSLKDRSGFIDNHDLEDIFQNFIIYLSEHEDYTYEKAIERSKYEGNCATLESFVRYTARNCTKRFMTEKMKREGPLVYADKKVRSNNGEIDKSIFDELSDESDQERYDDVLIDLEAICRDNEYRRYAYSGSVDIFLVFYVRMMTVMLGKPDKYMEALELLGISKREITEVNRLTEMDGFNSEMIAGISNAGPKSVEILGKMVYSKNRVDALLDAL